MKKDSFWERMLFMDVRTSGYTMIPTIIGNRSKSWTVWHLRSWGWNLISMTPLGKDLMTSSWKHQLLRWTMELLNCLGTGIQLAITFIITYDLVAGQLTNPVNHLHWADQTMDTAQLEGGTHIDPSRMLLSKHNIKGSYVPATWLLLFFSCSEIHTQDKIISHLNYNIQLYYNIYIDNW
jgi:hypothetical protein